MVIWGSARLLPSSRAELKGWQVGVEFDHCLQSLAHLCGGSQDLCQHAWAVRFGCTIKVLAKRMLKHSRILQKPGPENLDAAFAVGCFTAHLQRDS